MKSNQMVVYTDIGPVISLRFHTEHWIWEVLEVLVWAWAVALGITVLILLVIILTQPK